MDQRTQSGDIFAFLAKESPRFAANFFGFCGIDRPKYAVNPRLCYKYKTYCKCESKLKFALKPGE